MTSASETPRGGASPTTSRALAAILVPVAVGCAVAVALGVYGRLHEPTGFAINVAGFSGTLSVKTWLATAAFVFAMVQLGSALVMFGRIPGVAGPSWLGGLHRWSGRIAVLLTVPVVVHCLYALGFQYGSPRVLAHSLLGCLFYGAFVTKMLVLIRRGLPGWVLPAVGGLVFAGLTGLWLTSALWVFTTVGVVL
ncbi:DUF6529 family protein [Pseudonocardia asaccharolytica]|uniref:Uncharacterized protein n=1 Tax=Pseudonocardia asaccharolytica DSM 44247 = NBRC 16224 TaxID=1123024 RepID=A0A511CW34_9PSEU|nr:DUF6529 family protein [Pseudonocardia asaccharolytica]GEL16780.1 hypothetical protein PA7_06170 [Pseudonocardia asaccharolytica DSM 44247 = NBRC 16224]